MRFSAIIRTVLSMQVLAVCLLVGATFSSTYSPEEYQGPVEHNNTSVKLRGFAHQPSELDPISLSAPLFRNGILGAARFETDSSFKLDARAGGCQCSGLSNECCTPTASSEAPFCMPTGSTCCTNTYCVETESCCGDGGCCPANTTCYTKSTGPGCCPNGNSCSGPATCYDYTSSNCSDTTTPSAQCCPPDLPFCDFSEQAGYGCYATSAPAPSSTSSTNPSTTIPKSHLTTTTTSSTQTRPTKTITVAVISNPTGGLNLKFPFPSLFPSPQSTTEEEGEATKYILSNGVALSLENNPSPPQTGIASFIITGTISPSPTSSNNPTTSSSKPTTTPILSASSPPPISPPPPNSLTTSQTTGTTNEFPLATTISTSQSSRILSPFRLIKDHPHIFIFFYTLWIILLMEEGFSSNLLNILIAPWIIGNLVYSIFFYEVHFPAPPVAENILAEDRASSAGSEENENTRKKHWLHFIYSFSHHQAPIPPPPAPAEIPAEEGNSNSNSNSAPPGNETQLLHSWRLERLERSIETRERRVELQKCILERLERRRDRVERELERVRWREAMGRMVEAMRSSGR